MRVWRITRAAHAANPLSGEGAARSGNRWNSPGVRMAYASTSRPLAVLEMLVHVTRDTIPGDLRLIPIDVPDDSITELKLLPKQWNSVPYGGEARPAGDHWVKGQSSVALLVPSAVLRGERNLLINPLHPEIARVAVLAVESGFLDSRLFI